MTKEQKWTVVIGALGLLLTAASVINSYLIYQYQKAVDQTQISIAKQNTDVAAIQIFNTYLPALRGDDPRAQETFGFLAERFQKEYENPLFAELILHLEQQGRIQLDDKTVLQVTEATQPASNPSNNRNWIAVIHSYQAENRDRAQRGACNAILAIQEAWPDADNRPAVDVFLTRVSNNLAVTVGGFVSEAEAKSTASTLRASGIKDDAFAQINRDWLLQDISGQYLLEQSGGERCDRFSYVVAPD